MGSSDFMIVMSFEGCPLTHTSYCHMSDVEILKGLSALLCSLFSDVFYSFVFAFFSLLCSILSQASQPGISASYWYVFCSFMFAFIHILVCFF